MTITEKKGAIRACVLLLFAILLACQRPSPPEGAWYGLYYRSSKVGHQNITKRPRPGQGLIVTSETQLNIKMMGQDQAVTIIERTEMNDALALERFETSISSAAGTFRAEARMDGQTLVLTPAGGRATRIPLQSPLVVTAAFGLQMARQGPRVYGLIDAPAQAVDEALVEAMGPETRDVMGRPVGVRPYRITVKGLGLMVWVDEAGEVVEEELPLGIRKVREEARVAQGKVRSPVDLVEALSIRPTGQVLAHPEAAMSLRLRLKGADLTAMDLDGEGQSLRGDTLEVHRATLGDGKGPVLPLSPQEHAELAEALGPSTLITSEDKAIRKAAQRALGGATEALPALTRLVAFVHGKLTREAVAGVLSAADVLRLGRGDCNEHALLLAALARSVGLPCHIVVGLVMMDGRFYYHAWNEAWVGRWVAVDATLNQIPADVTHLRFLRGDLSRQGLLLKVAGKLEMEVLPAREGP